MKKYLYVAMLLPALLCACSGSDKNDEPEMPDDFRPSTDVSSPYQSVVLDYTPAPGQFINETVLGGFTGEENTPQKANEWALGRLLAKKLVSLGSFGGYITVGFDHSISNSGSGYDIAIQGNPIDTSNEPGIVWVMKDENRNGLADDTWYQLKGSETGNAATIENFSVTYYRPSEPAQPVRWTDSQGNEGVVDYLKTTHKQDYYYPAWITAESYTLTGTRLDARNSMDPATGQWNNPPYSWGYADNIGTDIFMGQKNWVGLKISNAIDAQGRPVDLDYIDFVKVQTGVLTKSGWLGESSTEVLSIADAHILQSILGE